MRKIPSGFLFSLAPVDHLALLSDLVGRTPDAWCLVMFDSKFHEAGLEGSHLK